jgi:hypothetical protein
MPPTRIACRDNGKPFFAYLRNRGIAKEAQMVAPMMIKDHMEIVGMDGVHVGTVDHMEGADEIKLTKDDPDAAGEHHFIPLAWVEHVDAKVHLKQSGAEAKARWKAH